MSFSAAVAAMRARGTRVFSRRKCPNCGYTLRLHRESFYDEDIGYYERKWSKLCGWCARMYYDASTDVRNSYEKRV
jgi:hypothetical protein